MLSRHDFANFNWHPCVLLADDYTVKLRVLQLDVVLLGEVRGHGDLPSLPLEYLLVRTHSRQVLDLEMPLLRNMSAAHFERTQLLDKPNSLLSREWGVKEVRHAIPWIEHLPDEAEKWSLTVKRRDRHVDID